MPSQSPRIAQPWALRNLPPFRPVAVKLIRLSAQDDVPLQEVQRVVRTDVAFSAEVLRLANSALIGSRYGVGSVEQAVRLVGLERLKALSMTIAMRDFVSAPKSGSTMEACWKYNLATAVICEWLAPLLALQPDACYTAGLLHDIGRLAILRAFPEEYQRMLSAIQNYEFDLLRCEKDLFDINHCDAGRWLLERWDFPSELRDVVELHHRQPEAGTPALVTVVYIAWQVADMLGYSPFDLRSAATIEEITVTLPEKARQNIFSGLDGLAETVTQKLATTDVFTESPRIE